MDEEAVYATLPTIACKGLCYACCGPIILTQAEYARLPQTPAMLGFPEGRLSDPVILLKPKEGTEECVHLTEEKRCAVYANRPLICRLWGVAEGMECPYGCEVTGMVTREEAGNLIRASLYQKEVP